MEPIHSSPCPVISVLVNTYNQEKTIARCLDSILSQNFSLGFEIILTDDASCDGTTRICRQYASLYPEIIRLYVNPRNLGIRDSYYNAILKCRGKYIADCAGDDCWIDNFKLSKEFAVLEQDKNIMLVHTGWKSLNSLTGKISLPQTAILPEKFSKNVIEGYKLMIPVLNREMPFIIHLCTALYRRDAIIAEYEKDKDLFRNPEFPCEDLQLICVLAAKGKIAYLPDITLLYSTSGMSDSSANSFRHNFDFYFGSLRLNRYLQAKFGISDEKLCHYHNEIIPYIASQLFNSGNNSGRKDFFSYISSIPFKKTFKYKVYKALTANRSIQKISLILKNFIRKNL